MANYIEINSEEEFLNTIKEGVSLVDFWAPWCGPCRMLAPVIDELGEEFKGKANICKVNTDANQDIAIKYNIRSIPAILFFKDGELLGQVVGVQPKKALADRINEYL